MLSYHPEMYQRVYLYGEQSQLGSTKGNVEVLCRNVRVHGASKEYVEVLVQKGQFIGST